MAGGIDTVKIDGGEAGALCFRLVEPGEHFVDAFLIGLGVLVGCPDGGAHAVMRHFRAEPEHDGRGQALLLGGDPDRLAFPPHFFLRASGGVEDLSARRIEGIVRHHAVVLGIEAGGEGIEVHESKAGHDGVHRLGPHAACGEGVEVRRRPVFEERRVQAVEADEQHALRRRFGGGGRGRLDGRGRRRTVGAAGEGEEAEGGGERCALPVHGGLLAGCESRVRAS